MAEPAADRPDMLAAALAYAAIGWPVFPVDPGDKQPLVGKLRDEDGNEIEGSGGLHRATTDAGLIRQWWEQWPAANIGVPTGQAIGAFVVDLDAGVDEKTGEIFEAGQLLANLEAEVGVPLPATWTVETPRGGRHLYFAWPGERVRNRTGMIHRVDVRGDGGYVVVPPSTRPDGRAYRWLVERQELPPGPPERLVDLALRRGRWARDAAAAPPAAHANVDEAVRKYALSALDREARTLAGAAEGTRNQAINDAAFALGGLVGAGALSEGIVRATLRDVVAAWPNRRKSEGTIESGLRAGVASPRDLSNVGEKSRTRRGATLRVVGGTVEPLPPPEERDEPRAPLELREILRQERRRLDPPPLESRNGYRAGDWTPDRLGLPRDDPCPVIPLGFDGELMYFLNSSGQLVGWTEQRFTHAGIQKIFAAMPNYPEWMCPRFGKAKSTTDPNTGETDTIFPIESFKDDAVRKLLFRAIDHKGPFSPDQKVRGRGAWRMADNGIYYHAGEELWIVEGQKIRAIATGIVDDGGADLVFPRMAALPPPWPKAIGSEENPARELILGFRKWNWDMPEVAPVLLLGWIGVGFLGGALDWRSAVSLIGDKGTGKSALQQLIKELFGDALFDRANTSAADIYQHLRHDSRPVAVDEMEATGDDRKATAVIDLMKQASSGAMGGRGGADGVASEFQLRSAFLFSAINNPPMNPQDLSRIALLRLRELPKRTNGELQAPPVIVDAETCGRKILSRLLLEWHRFPKTLAVYKDVLETIGGHVGRGGDTYGTLLAAADLILGPELAEELGIPMVDDLRRWGELLHVDTLPEIGDALPNWRAAVNQFLQALPPSWRGGRRSAIGQFIEDLGDSKSVDEATYLEAKRVLADIGVGLRRGERGWILEVPNQHPKVAELFAGTRWQGMPGAGAWSEAMRQAPRGVCFSDRKKTRVRIGGVLVRCTFIDLARLKEEDDREDD